MKLMGQTHIGNTHKRRSNWNGQRDAPRLRNANQNLDKTGKSVKKICQKAFQYTLLERYWNTYWNTPKPPILLCFLYPRSNVPIKRGIFAENSFIGRDRKCCFIGTLATASLLSSLFYNIICPIVRHSLDG